jgi:hypothetical protein
MRDKLGLKTEVGEVLLNLPANKGAEQAQALGLAGVNFNDFLSMKGSENSKVRVDESTNLLKTALDEVVTGQPNVLRRTEALERNLILVRLLELLPAENLIDSPLLTFDNDQSTIFHLLHLLLRDLAVGLGHLLQIFTSLVTPEHVLEGSLVKVVINVVEGMLSNVTDNQVGVLPDLTALVWLHVANQELDESGLARTVGTENGNTRGEGDLECDIVELLDGLCWVLEANLAPTLPVSI